MILIRRAKIEDAVAISKIHALSWKTAYKGIVPQKYLDELKVDFWVTPFQKWIANGTLVADILFVDSIPIGCIAYGKSRDDQLPEWGEIVSIYIHPEHCRKGYGGMLLRHALKQMNADSYKSCYLWVLSENINARRFYEESGFSHNGDLNKMRHSATDERGAFFVKSQCST